MSGRRRINDFSDCRSMRNCMRRALDSSVRDGHSLHRMFVAFRKTLREKGEGASDPSFLSLFDNGNYTIVTGDGELFNRFCRNKSIGKYTGRNVKPRYPSDDDYSTSRLRVYPFDYAFNYTTNDVDKDEWFDEEKDKHRRDKRDPFTPKNYFSTANQPDEIQEGPLDDSDRPPEIDSQGDDNSEVTNEKKEVSTQTEDQTTSHTERQTQTENEDKSEHHRQNSEIQNEHTVNNFSEAERQVKDEMISQLQHDLNQLRQVLKMKECELASLRSASTTLVDEWIQSSGVQSPTSSDELYSAVQSMMQKSVKGTCEIDTNSQDLDLLNFDFSSTVANA